MGNKGKQKSKQKGNQSGIDEHRTFEIINTLDQYKVKGRDINKEYCVFKDRTPIMLPPAPKQTYIDVYPDKEGTSSSNIEDEKRKQANYEAEVKVYRALEKLQEEILVLHGLEYTHHQYRLCDTSHDRKSCGLKCKKNAANREGECDFLVIGKNYFVIIEVKNIPHDEDEEITETKKRELNGALRKSQEQCKKVNYLIESIIKGAGTEKCTIFHFSAFPSSHRILFKDLDKDDETQIICEEDVLQFTSWWLRNVTELIPNNVTDIHEEVKEMLIALWCTDQKNQCDEQRCNLGKCIMDIDEELSKGRITFRSKKRSPNPNVIKATDIKVANINSEINIFRDYIGVDNLTAEQCDAFNRDQNLLLINGPAGSGKTIILLAKIIQLIKSNEQNRVVLFIFDFSLDNNSHKRYQDTLQKANISNEVVVVHWLDSADTAAKKISASSQNNQVVRARMRLQYDRELYKVLNKLIGSNTHVFVDDCQAQLYYQESNVKSLLHSCKKLSETNLVWISCDLTQRNLISRRGFGGKIVRTFIQGMPSENIVTLSLNLRNTSDIAGILSKIREQLIEEETAETVNCCDIVGTLSKIRKQFVKLICGAGTEEETADIIDVVLPVVQPGHFIHGPRTVVHAKFNKKVDENDPSVIVNILNIELDKLCNTSVSGGFKIGVVVGDLYSYNYITTLRKIIKETIEQRSTVPGIEIELCNVADCYSAEYPAVIVVHHDYYTVNYTLYLEISRARVYCAVIVFTSVSDQFNNRSNSTYRGRLSNMLDKLDDSVRIIKYEPTDD